MLKQKLMKRESEPPFKPAVIAADSTFYFDREFTSRTPRGEHIFVLKILGDT